METLLIGLVLLFGVLLVAVPILLLAMHARLRRLEASMQQLERQQSARAPGRTPQVLAPAPQSGGERRATGQVASIAPEAASPFQRAHGGASAAHEKAPPMPVDLLYSADAEQERDPLAEAPQRTPKPRVEWEKWVGVRGAALLGGILLALAGLLFFQHSLEQGWVGPTMRVVSGCLGGLAALVASEVLRRREFKYAPAATAGAGVVILYATTWASYGLYAFIPVGLALPAMGLLTFLCAWLALRLSSQFVAVLGLVGGFATPLLLSMPADQPLGLFGYLLLLDLGLLALGRRLGSSLLATLGMLATFILECVWIVQHLGPADYPLALASLAIFGMLFAIAGQRSEARERGRWLVSQAGALLLPFVFAIYFSTITDLGEQLWPLAILAAILGVGASWIAARQASDWLVLGAASGALATVAAWLVRRWASGFELWQLTACSLGLAAVFYGADLCFNKEPQNQGATTRRTWLAPCLLGVGFLFVLLVAALVQAPTNPWPWLVAVLGHAFLLHLVGRRPGAGLLRPLAAVLASLTLGAYLLHLSDRTPTPGVAPALDAAWVLGAALCFAALGAWSTRSDAEREARLAWHACAAFALLLLLCLPAQSVLMRASSPGSLGLLLSLALVALLAASKSACGIWPLLLLPLFALKRWIWIAAYLEEQASASQAGALYLLEWLSCALLVAAPLLGRRSLGASRLAWLASALLLCLSLFAGERLLAEYLPQAHPWASAAALAVMGLALGALARQFLPSDAPQRDHAARCLLGTGAALLALALARFVEHHVLVIGSALAGLLLALLWRRLPNLGLNLIAAGLVVVSVLLLLVEVLLSLDGKPGFESGPWLVWNWSSYASAVPAACALGAARLFLGSEAASAKQQEPEPLHKLARRASQLLSICSLLLAFLWLNLQVLVYYETEPMVHFDFDNLPARDLTLSISWILFALLLLAGGMLRSVSNLRQASLVFLLLTLIKLFLHDLGDLTGLYRVGSILGLAISLLLVSLLYQRFVFPRRRSE